MELLVYVSGSALVLAAGYLAFRRIARRDYLRTGRLTPFAILMEYVAIGSWVLFTSLNLPRGWPTTHVGPAQEAVGSILFYGGLSLTLLNIVLLGIRRSHGLEANELRQSRFYGLTRNPQALCFVIAIVGNLVLWPTWRNLVALILLGVLVHLIVITEEEHLHRAFGDEYARYCQRVPRYLGFRRRRG